ncbi:DUF4157 domain-containing protein [Flavivirga aquimarina]|uniref:DUF4157 domain-containing protein n=1 Tax=Flavivirga aquimarina TaxID=2027862 RepID=A0ABT8W929_9FLAO|nr:DUF4157 domain-containing protein [Flavivirga aquimarina]MDO5969581.1 DUF4157 domain-containing protein [Flavivirga aquimarina]
MNTYADKIQDKNHYHAVSTNATLQKQKDDAFAVQFMYNSCNAAALQKLNKISSNSPRTLQLKALQEKANNSPKTKQAIQLQAIVNNYTALIQRKENHTTGLPDNLKTGIENLSGYSMDDVKVHRNSNKPTQLNAHAYAQGTDIHLASGQEKHLPHEAWHVVQQKQGRVKPTLQTKNKININDDAALEKEADIMGTKALQRHHTEKNTFEFPFYRTVYQTPSIHGGTDSSLQLMADPDGISEKPNTSMSLSPDIKEIDLRDKEALPRGEVDFNVLRMIVRKQKPVGEKPDLDLLHWELLFLIQNEHDREWIKVDLTLDGYRILSGVSDEARRPSLDEEYINTSNETLTKSKIKAAVEELAPTKLNYYNPSKKSPDYKPEFENFRYSCQTFVNNMIEKLELISTDEIVEKTI